MLTSSLQNWESRIGRADWVCREFERKAVAKIDLNKFKKILEDNEERGVFWRPFFDKFSLKRILLP